MTLKDCCNPLRPAFYVVVAVVFILLAFKDANADTYSHFQEWQTMRQACLEKIAFEDYERPRNPLNHDVRFSICMANSYMNAARYYKELK